MLACARCGKFDHAEGACPTASRSAGSAPPSSRAPRSAHPPSSASGELSASPPFRSGAFATTGGGYGRDSEPPSQDNPTSRELRLLKTQLYLAVGQREEDPERAWLEAVSIRERLAALRHSAGEDPLLLADVERFRDKLEAQIAKLTRDMGDEILAPLYSWVDLLRQRAELDVEVETARQRVLEARAARGAEPGTAPSTELDAREALEAAEGQLAWWKTETPPAPPPGALRVWTQSGGDALRPTRSGDPQAVRARGILGRRIVDGAGLRPLGEVRYPGSWLERGLALALPTCALAASLVARSAAWRDVGLDAAAAVAWGLVLAAGVASFAARRRGAAERRAALEVVWHYTLFTEQVAAVDLEVGWLRVLTGALRGQRAFDVHQGEGGQLAELARWRPDLLPFVAEVARSSVSAGSAHEEGRGEEGK
jgi:hypothetical protein